MKRTILLLITLIFLGLNAAQAQFILVSGYVTNEVNGDPVANHDVFIMTDDTNAYFSTVQTFPNGYYVDTIPSGGSPIAYVTISTNDICYFLVHDTTIYNPGSQVSADFEICVDSLPGQCQADFYYIPDSTDQNTINFFDISSSTGGIDSWFWDFADGTSSTLQNPVHTFASAGTYEVCLTITANAGACTSTLCTFITINPSGNLCQADFYYVIDTTANNTGYFYDLSTPAGSVDSWFWDFADGTTSTLQNPVHTFAAAGTYDVCLTITADSLSCTSTLCYSVTITPGVPVCQAAFYYVIDSSATDMVYFYDQSTPVGMIDTWTWDFGDGNTSSLQNPVHTYDNPGTYQVCLTILADSMTCTSTACQSVEIIIQVNYQLGGNVFAGIYQLDAGLATAYKMISGAIAETFTATFDTLGYYMFYPMVSADYYVKAEPTQNSSFFGYYMPTYFGNTATWDEAVMISLNQNVYTADINLIPISQNPGGDGQIAGTIMQENQDFSGVPAEGVQFMLSDDAGEFVGLTYSNEYGYFNFSNLAFGTYQLYAEVTGLQMVPGTFILSEENSMISNINMIMTETEIYFGPTGIEAPDNVAVGRIYPNPVRDKLRFNISLVDPTEITIRILGQLGQTLQQETMLVRENQTIELNTGELGQGLYILEIFSSQGYRATHRFVKL